MKPEKCYGTISSIKGDINKVRFFFQNTFWFIITGRCSPLLKEKRTSWHSGNHIVTSICSESWSQVRHMFKNITFNELYSSTASVFQRWISSQPQSMFAFLQREITGLQVNFKMRIPLYSLHIISIDLLMKFNKLSLLRNRIFLMENTIILYKMDNKLLVWHEARVFACF